MKSIVIWVVTLSSLGKAVLVENIICRLGAESKKPAEAGVQLL
jgi:hypothetical protein